MNRITLLQPVCLSSFWSGADAVMMWRSITSAFMNAPFLPPSSPLPSLSFLSSSSFSESKSQMIVWFVWDGLRGELRAGGTHSQSKWTENEKPFRPSSFLYSFSVALSLIHFKLLHISALAALTFIQFLCFLSLFYNCHLMAVTSP